MDLGMTYKNVIKRKDVMAINLIWLFVWNKIWFSEL